MIKLMTGRVMGLKPYSFRADDGKTVTGKVVYVEIGLGDSGQGSMGVSCSAGLRYLADNPLDLGEEICIGRDASGKYQIIDSDA